MHLATGSSTHAAEHAALTQEFQIHGSTHSCRRLCDPAPLSGHLRMLAGLQKRRKHCVVVTKRSVGDS